MKATKLIAVCVFAAFGFCADSAFAQGNEQNNQTAPPVTTEQQASPAEEISTDPYNETVTIDSVGTPPISNDGSGVSEQAEKKEKLRVYSGKHDGNNVISDPR